MPRALNLCSLNRERVNSAMKYKSEPKKYKLKMIAIDGGAQAAMTKNKKEHGRHGRKSEKAEIMVSTIHYVFELFLLPVPRPVRHFVL